MAIAVTDILAGPMKIFNAPVGTTVPANTLAEGAAWPAGWTEIAYTKEPLKVSYEIETFNIRVEQALSDVARRKTDENVMFETVLAEFRTQSMALAFGGTHTQVTAPAVGVEGIEEFTVGGQIFMSERAWGFEGVLYNNAGDTGYPARVIIYRATIDEGGEMEFSKEDYAGIPLKIKALADTSKTVGAQLFRVFRSLPALP